MNRLKFICASKDSTVLAFSDHAGHAKSRGLRIIGISTTIPANAHIIHGGLSSPFWLEPDGEAGIPGARIEPIDRAAISK